MMTVGLLGTQSKLYKIYFDDYMQILSGYLITLWQSKAKKFAYIL